MSKQSITVIVPVYKSSATLDELHRRVTASLNPIAEKLEFIFVDDSGTPSDNSWATICRLAANDQRVRGLQHSRNYGQHNALLTGIRAASNDIIVTIDDDLQNPPEEIPKLLALLDQGHDVVYGTPVKLQHGILRDFASHMTKLALQGAMGVSTARNVSAFRAFRTFLRDAFRDYQNPHVSIDVLLTWGTNRFTAVTVKHDTRQVGVSNYTFGKLITHALNMITGFTILPLRLASFIGFFFTLFGMVLLTYVLGRYFLFGSTVAGFSFIASMVAIFSGAQMFALGIMGEYLARMHLRSMGQPVSLTRLTVGTTR